MTRMTNLPKELEEEIVSRVPLKSMKAVRLTCKKWNALLESPSFTRRHISNVEAKEEEESRMIVMKDYDVHLMSTFVKNENASTKPLGKLNNKEQIKISQVFHCEGLLLCILKDDGTRLVVWNPYLGQTRWIETTFFDGMDTYYKYGIGYENKSCHRSYKILRFTDSYIGPRHTIHHRLWYETYDFDSNSWTSHYLTSTWSIPYCHRGLSLKGNTYWCATNPHIVCFDFTKMSFCLVQDLPLQASYEQLVALSCVGDEKLSFLSQPIGSFVIDIWITSKIEVNDMTSKVAWNKFLRIDKGPLSDLRMLDVRFFIEEDKRIVMVFSKDGDERLDTVKIFGEDGYFSELDLGVPSDKNCWPLVCPYVPSLVQIKLPEQGKTC